VSLGHLRCSCYVLRVQNDRIEEGSKRTYIRPTEDLGRGDLQTGAFVNENRALFIVCFIAVLAPLAAQLPALILIPSVVLELTLGILIGPSGAHLVTSQGAIGFFGEFGLMFLLKQTVQQHRSVPRREYEAIAVEPFGIGRVVFEEPCPQHIGHRRGPHRHSRVPAISLLHSVHGEEAQSVDALIIQCKIGIQCRIGRHCRRRCVHSNFPL
jgi:hypothetical protein